MSAFAYYNEIDANAVAWLNELIKAGAIADGVVDSRPLQEVDSDDLSGFTQCHFFAGIGVWSHALRLAGWPDDRQIWTGSCPCQPFSVSGKKKGFADDRHLWPYWIGHITERRPPVVVGEQVASPDGLTWLDTVWADLESQDYAVGAADLCAAGVGAPHIRQRLYFVGDSALAHAQRERGRSGESRREDAGDVGVAGEVGGLADTESRGRGEHRVFSGATRGGKVAGQLERGGGDSGRVADDDTNGCDRQSPTRLRGRRDGAASGQSAARDVDGTPRHDADGRGEYGGANPTHGFWGDPDWLLCRDGKWRPVGSGTFPLAHGTPARVGRLRGYGNAIVAQVAATFIEAYLDARGGVA